MNLYGLRTGTATTSLLTAAFAIVGTGNTGIDVRNNIFANNITGGTTSIANVSIYLPSGGTAAMTLTNNNNAYFSGADAARQGAGQAGTTAGTNFFVTLGSLAGYTSTLGSASNDNVSQWSSAGPPPFVTDTDLHLTNLTVFPANALLSAGATIGSVTNDFDMDPRPASNPDIGADEVVQSEAGTFPAGTFYNALGMNGDTLGGNVTITNRLELTGIVNTGGNTLTIGCNGIVTFVTMSQYIVGNLTKQFCTTGSFTFPVGTTPDNMLVGNPPEQSLFSANVTAIGVIPSTLTVNVVDGTLAGSDPMQSASRYWDVTETGDITADISFTYLDQDIMGMESGYQVLRRESGMTTTFMGGTVNAVTNTGTATGVMNFSQWGAGMLVPTAANATISGQVFTANKQGIRNAVVMVTGGGLSEPRYVQTGSFGKYQFDDLAVGQTYVITVLSKRYFFQNPSFVINLDGDLSDVNFEAEER